MWLTIFALILALSSAFGCVYLYLDSLQRPKKSELRDLLETQSASVLKQYQTSFRSLETEWDDMYQKFSRLAGRMDRQKALAPSEKPEEEIIPAPHSRAELLRRHRAK